MKEFQAVFQLSKTIIFEVRYYTLSTNSRPYFSTTAARFCRNKRDYSQCGQDQDTLTRGFLTCRRFWQKWDKLHLSDLTPAQYDELQKDMEALKAAYNFIYEELDETKKPYSPKFGFYRLAEWTKQAPKKGA